MERNKMKIAREENYKKWFDRWMNGYDLKKQIEIANNKNYTCLYIPIYKVRDERDKLMMVDDKFVEMLKKEFIDFKITKKMEIENRYFLSRKIGEVEQSTVYIDWSN